MKKGHRIGLRDKYMSPILILALLFISCLVRGQSVYRPSNSGYFTPSNKPYAPATPIPTDGRTYKLDSVNGLFRPYNGTAEVLTYLPTGSQYRVGQFPIVVNIGGSLQSNGTFVGGQVQVYWFLRGQADTNLVRMDSTSSGTCSGCLLKANNLSDVQSLLTTLINLNLNNVDNTSDATKWSETATLTNKSISGLTNTFSNIPNSALANNSIGLTLDTAGSSPSVSPSPAALGSSLGLHIPWAGVNSGLLKASAYAFFNGKLDSVHISNDSVYNCVNGTCTLQSVISGGSGAVLSVNPSDGSLVFSPTTGNVLGSINTAHGNTWTGQQTFNTSAPIFGTLTTNGGVFYGNGSGLLLQTTAGTSGQIFESQGSSGPIFFSPGPSTVNGWLGYTALSNALGSTHIFVGNGSNVATDVAMTGAASISNTGVFSLTPTITAGSCTNCSLTYNAAGQLTAASSGAGSGVSSVTNSDGTLTISPNTGAVVASLALGHANIWITNPQTFNGGLALGSNVTFDADNTRSIGTPTIGANAIYSHFFESNGALGLGAGTSSPINFTIGGGANKMTLLSSGQLQLNTYTTSTSYTGTPLAFLGTDVSGNVVQTPVGNLQTSLSNTPSGGFPLFNLNASAIRELFGGTNVTIDSTTNPGGYTISATGSGGGLSQIYGQPPFITVHGTDTAVFVPDTMATKIGYMPINFSNHQTVNGGLLWSYDNYWTATTSNNFLATNITATLSGNKVQLSSSANTFLPMYFKNQTSYLEHWSKTDTVIINSTPSSTTYGVWTGMGLSTFGCDNCGFVDLTTSGSAGKISIVTEDTVRTTSSTAITFATGDTLVTTFGQAADTLSFTVTDKNNASSVTLPYVVANAFSQGYGDQLHTTHYYALGVKGGTYTLVGSRVTNLERVNAPVAWVGDSKFFGDFAGSLPARAGTMLNSNYIQTDMFGSAGDNIANTLSRINDIIAVRPQMAILETYCNDLRQGHSLAQVISDFQHLYSYLEGNGIRPYIVTAPEVALATVMAQFDSAVRVLYPDSYIPVYDALSACGSPCLASDGIHWTTQGNDSVYAVIIRSGKIPRSTYLSSTPRGTYYQGLAQEKVASDLNLWKIGGNPNVGTAVGANGYSTIGIPGTSANMRFDWDYNRRITLNRALSSAAYMTFGSQTGSIWGDVYMDSLANVGLGYNTYSGGNPTQFTNTRVGYESGYHSAMASSNTTMIGAYAGAAATSGPTLANNVFIGYQSGYYETNPWRYYFSMDHLHTFLFGDSSRMVVHNPSNGTSPLTFPTNDNLQVVGSEYISDTLVLNNVRDGSPSADSVALLTQIAPGKFVLHKGAPIGAGGTPNIATVLNSATQSANATWTLGGNTLTFSGLSHDTTSSFGLLGMGKDSIVRVFSWTNVAAEVSPLLPSFNIYPVQGLSPIGTHNDSIQLGGSAGAFFQADTIVTNGFGFYVTGLPNKAAPASTDSSIIQTTSGQLYKTPLASGTWTPTITTGTNISAGTGNSCTYSRVGNVVTFSGSANVTVTSANTASVFNISIPLSSTFTAITDGNGTVGANAALSANPLNVIANTVSGNTLTINFGSGSSTGGYIIFFSGQYLVH